MCAWKKIGSQQGVKRIEYVFLGSHRVRLAFAKRSRRLTCVVFFPITSLAYRPACLPRLSYSAAIVVREPELNYAIQFVDMWEQQAQTGPLVSGPGANKERYGNSVSFWTTPVGGGVNCVPKLPVRRTFLSARHEPGCERASCS